MYSIDGYNSATPGDFGALAGKIRFMDEGEISNEIIVKELCSIQEEKCGVIRKIGFGAV